MSSSRLPPRVSLVALAGLAAVAAVLLALLVGLGAAGLDGPAGQRASPSAPPHVARPAVPALATHEEAGDPVEESAALRVLHAWDARRAAAYTRGSPAALRRLYLPGSRAGSADVAVLRAYRARGLRVRLRTQVLGLDVRAASVDRLRLRVVDRLAGAVASGRGRRWVLPRDATSTRLVSFARAGPHRWRVAAVRDVPVRPARRPDVPRASGARR